MGLDFSYDAVIVSLPEIQAPRRAVLRRLGYPPGTREIDPAMEQILAGVTSEAKHLSRPEGIYRIYRVQENNGNRVTFEGTAFSVESRQVAKMLSACHFMVLMVVTIGRKLEDEVERLLAGGEMIRGYALDAVGSETADAVAEYLHRDILKKKGESEGYGITPRFSPGYGDWPLTVQGDIISECSAGRIGITLTSSFLMIPRKSVTAVLGFF